MKTQQNANEDLRVIAIQAVFDTLMVYDRGIMRDAYSVCPNIPPLSFQGVDEALQPESWVTLFTELLAQEESSEEVRAVLCMGLAKLALPGVLVDQKVCSSISSHSHQLAD